MPTSTTTGNPNGPGNRSQKQQGQSQRSEPCQPSPQRAVLTVQATAARIHRARVNGQRHRSQHLCYQRQRSEPSQPAPKRAVPTVSTTAASTRTSKANGRFRYAFRPTRKRMEIILVYDRNHSRDYKHFFQHYFGRKSDKITKVAYFSKQKHISDAEQPRN